VCYKPDMRKWMRDRMKRRKKQPEKAGGEAQLAPLQPAFYDNAPAEERAPAVEEVEAAEPVEVEARPAGEAEPAKPGAGDAARRRRRRSRGGRGRSKKAPQVAAPEPETATPPASEPAPAVLPEVPAAAAPTPAQVTPPSAPARAPKGTVVLAIGLPGSGKSSWFKRHQLTPLSSDLLRTLLFDDPTEQRFQDLIFSNLRSMLKARLIARRPLNYVDATNLTPHDRHGWIKLAKDYGYEVQAVYFDVPLETCLERNRKRDRVVPEDVMRRMAGKMKAPTFEEGFSKITVVRVKQKEVLSS